MGCDEKNACKYFKESKGVNFLTPVYGVCSTFNFGPYMSLLGINLDMAAANVAYGLTLEIDIECKKYLFFEMAAMPFPLVFCEGRHDY